MTSPSRSPLGAGVRLGAYTILAKLGEGGMGAVYRAHDERLGRDVALKVLPDAVIADPVRLARFAREARAIAALNHPHIVTIYSTEEIDGLRFFTMELVDGQTLDAIIPSTGLPVPRFLELALPIADALTAAHQKLITHRDLKPANVMVSSDGRVKVLDFGLARIAALDDDHALASTKTALTHDGTVVGTMPYMSPEQVEGRAIDHRSDLFSAGVMFYEMLVGVRPFHGESSARLMSTILRDAPPELAERRPDVPRALSRLVDRMLEKRPEDRIQTARDVYNELRLIARHVEGSSGDRGSAPHQPVERRGSGGRLEPPARSITALTVAVLPFTSRGGDDASSMLADGLTDDITTGLSRFAHLRVLSRDAAARLAGVPTDMPASGTTPGARYLLSGTVRSAGPLVRVTVRLVESDTDTTLWADTHDRDTSIGVFALQDEIASRIVANVGDTSGVLARAMGARLIDVPVDQLTIPEFILRFHAYVEHFRPDEHARLRDGLERALERDPSSAQGWACLSRLIENEHSHQLNPKPDAIARQRRAAERSVEIDPQCQAGWMALAAVQLFNRDLTALRAAVQRAVSLNPLDADATALCGIYLGAAGDYERGVELARRASGLKAQHPGWYHFPPFTAHYVRGEYEEALREAKQINMPLMPTAHLVAAAAAGQLGRAGEARAAVEGMTRLDPRLLEPAVARNVLALWIWDEALLDRLMDGVGRAIALVRTA